MRAGEWISWYDSMGEWPDSGNMETDRFYATAIDNADVIIRDLLAEVEKYERKHSEMGEGSGCPPDGDCGGDDWTCKKCWAKYWKED